MSHSNIICLVVVLSLCTVLQAYPSSSVATAAGCDLTLNFPFFNVQTKCDAGTGCTTVTVNIPPNVKTSVDVCKKPDGSVCVEDSNSPNYCLNYIQIPFIVLLPQGATTPVTIGVQLFPLCANIKANLPRC